MNLQKLRAPEQVLLTALSEVMDPEVPVVSVVDLGIVRAVAWEFDTLVVTVTPAYSGCPATQTISQAIRDRLAREGIENVLVRTQLSPPWTTDWMTAAGREALRQYGIAPPACGAPSKIDTSALLFSQAQIACPLCGSANTRLLSQFGSTACKALYRCNACLEPFDYFKPH